MDELVLRALKILTKYCTNGDRYIVCNPYCVPEIKLALKAIALAQGSSNWLDANDDLREKESSNE